MAYKMETILKAGDMFDRGVSVAAVAKKLGVSMEQAVRWKTRHRLGCLGKPIDSETIQSFFRKHPHITYRQAAHQLGVHITTISNCLIKAGDRKITEKGKNDKAISEYFKAHPEATNAEIGEKVGGLSVGQVGYTLCRLGLKREKKAEIPDKKFSDFVEKNPKLSYRKVADHFGVTLYAVSGKMRQLGLARREIEKKKAKQIVNIAKKSPATTHAEMSRITGMSTHFVESTLHKAGLINYWRNGRRAEAKKVQKFLAKDG